MREVLSCKRKKSRLTQKEAAKLLGISLSFYRKIEQGSRNPGLELAQKIANLFNTTVEEIFFNNIGHSRCHNRNTAFLSTGTDD